MLRTQPIFSTVLLLSMASFACGKAATTADSAAPEAPPPPVAKNDGFPEEPFRATPPAATQPRSFQLPGVQQFKLQNGISVYLVERHDLPIVSATLSFPGGSLDDPKQKSGRAGVCMDMLTEGTKELEKVAFDEAVADLASSIDAYADHDTQGLSFRTLSTHLDATFELFADAVRSPAFRGGEFNRLVKQRRESLKQMKGSAPAVAYRIADNVLYGEDTARGRLVTEKSLDKIAVSDCKRHHRDYVRPDGAELFVVGDMTQAQIVAKFEAGLDGWKGKPKATNEGETPQTRDGKIFFINIPGAAQSAINVVHFGPDRKAPDYYANTMMSAVLGGGFASRVNMNLREDKGYSYGARGSFDYDRRHGVFMAATSVRSDATYQSVVEIFSELNGMKSGTKPITEAELEREKNGEILGLPAKFATARDALRRYRELVYFGLPLDYYNSLVDNVSSVTLPQVVASAATHLQPQNARIIVAGDAKAPMIRHTEDGQNVPLLDAAGQPVSLLDALRNLAASGAVGTGNVVVLDADGNVVG